MSARWLLFLGLASGCGEPRLASIEITAIGGGWSDEYENRITILHGQAVVVRVRPISSAGRPLAPYDFVELHGGNPDVVELLPGRSLAEHALLGVAVGRTRFDVSIDGEQQTELTVIVQAQREPDD